MAEAERTGSRASGPAEGGWRTRAGATRVGAAVPEVDPLWPDGLLEAIRGVLDGLGAARVPWSRHLASSVRLVWLDPEDSRLGVTRWDEAAHELMRRRRLGLAPGAVEVGLHPVLVEDEGLYRHTLAHELLHAAGMVHHDADHDRLVAQIAPAPRLTDSPVLQRLRDGVLARQVRQQWTCVHCGYEWQRRTVRAPNRCPKCAKAL